MLSADLRAAVTSAAEAAGHSGPWHDVGLRDGGAPGRYLSMLPLRLGPAPASSPDRVGSPAPASSPDRVGAASAMASALRSLPWIDSAWPAVGGYLTITVTPRALADVAVRVTRAGPACARSDALAGTRATLPPGTPLTAARTWPEARDLVAAQVTARLAAAAGATVAADDMERSWPPGFPAAGAPARRGTGGAEPDAAAGAPAASPVADAVAFAGPDAIIYALARIPAKRRVALCPGAVARHVQANPAYAVRYAHSCAASTLRWAAALGLATGEADAVQPGSLAHPEERALLAALSWLPEQVARAARRGRPHEFTSYLEELAETYQVCRTTCPAWPEREHDGARRDGTRGARPADACTVRARLWLAGAAAAGLAAGLELLGVGAPSRL